MSVITRYGLSETAGIIVDMRAVCAFLAATFVMVMSAHYSLCKSASCVMNVETAVSLDSHGVHRPP